MTEEQESRAERLFHRALALPREERRALLLKECAGDEPLRREVEYLIEAHEADPDFLFADSGAASRESGGVEAPLGMLGKYRLLRELGRGGQGSVYLARDEDLGREVALKILLVPLAFSPEAIARFRREASAAARVDDPGICTVYEAGVADGVHFIAMRFVDGRTLAARLSAARRNAAGGVRPRLFAEQFTNPAVPGGKTPSSQVRGILAFFERTARSLQHAHESGLVHRDIKPANIMVTPAGDSVILDFGLVRDAGPETQSLTDTGAMLGTPHYMAPELLQGARATTSSDVYSLTATLYECLTLHPPFDGATRHDIFREILTAVTPDPRRLNPQVPRDLAVVLEVGLERDPNRRYRTARDLADDLRRIQEHVPIHARPAGPLLRAQRLVQRNPVAASVGGTLLTALIAALVMTFLFIRRQERALRHTQAIALAGESVRLTETDAALSLILGLEAVGKESNLTSTAALQQACASIRERGTLKGHGQFVSHVEAAEAGDRILSSGGDGTARLWDGESLVATIHADPTGGDVLSSLSPDGRRLSTVTQDGRVALWDDTRREVRTLPGTAAYVPPQFSVDGKTVLWATEGGAVMACKDLGGVAEFEPRVVAELGSPVAHLLASPADARFLAVARSGDAVLAPIDGEGELVVPQRIAPRVDHCAFLPDGSGVLLAVRPDPGKDRTALLQWDGADDPRELYVESDPVLEIALPPDASRIAYATESGRVCVLTLEGRRVETLLDDRGIKLDGLRYSPDGQWIAVHAKRSSMLLSVLGSLPEQLSGHEHWVEDLCFRRDGTLVTASADRTLRLWTLNWGDRFPRIVVGSSSGFFWGGTFSPEGDRILCTGRGAWVADRHGRRVIELEGSELECDYGVYSPDGTRFAICRSTDGSVQVRDRDGRLAFERSVPYDPARLRSVTFSPDGEWLVASWLSLLVWDRNGTPVLGPSQELVRGPAQHYLTHTDFSPDGAYLVSGGINGAVLWNRDLELEHEYPCEQVRFCLFHPDGRRVITFHADGRARIWDLRGVEPLAVIEGHEGALWRGDVSADGRLLATASYDGTARVWDLDEGRCLHVLSGHRGPVLAAELSPDGESLMTTSMDGSVRLWPLASHDLIELAEGRCHRGMTPRERAYYQDLLR